MNIFNFILIILLTFINPIIFAGPLVADTDADEDREITSYKNMYSMDNACRDVYDPYEKLNRQIYKFNSAIDFLILRPLAVGYNKITNDYTRSRVSSFIENINTPLTTVNYGLQLDYEGGIKSFWRFLLNSTFGIAGLFDVASKMGLPAAAQTFGDTLGHYGVGPGPYLILPLFGGTTARNITDSVLTSEYYLPKNIKLGYNITKAVHQRAKLLPFTDHVMENSIDSYVAIRSAIYQNRESNVRYPKNFTCPTQNK